MRTRHVQQSAARLSRQRMLWFHNRRHKEALSQVLSSPTAKDLEEQERRIESLASGVDLPGSGSA